EAWTFPGGASDNALFYTPHIRFVPRLDEAAQMLLFDPQTSGGLLMAVPPDRLAGLREQAAERQQPFWEIGEVIPETVIEVV
ncbi:MAG TPA: AIR synthase-related protein, partial [Anaerolineaceae bacterium]|nr:AIR synthase-related protein [Anaerolineaceae bacterium]